MQSLSNETGIPVSTISSIKQRESITALKKKCRELGIYNEIFGDLNSTIINQGNNSRAAGRDYIKNSNDKKQEDMFDDITIGLIKKAIEKFGSEEEFQFQFMNFLRDK
ncbi:hypothetical protein [Aliarcobacter thereius]|uniref:Uncharacterized protein n=1 Tax=Aliarcobacter thereius TaxID=544718 RepID=A0A5R9H9Z5_9BACT|nr:hypothetical protein [Aliarcobacter thereius]TLS72948.1 hypothetical protein FE246_00230 [Aliarcobacter thereius]TLS91524.1 hypothetical protein FE244_08970 [Aliarcobacter thereius]TLT08360.1 hypothetical protein FE243_00245 [Aliarcobacter thereius]